MLGGSSHNDLRIDGELKTTALKDLQTQAARKMSKQPSWSRIISSSSTVLMTLEAARKPLLLDKVSSHNRASLFELTRTECFVWLHFHLRLPSLLDEAMVVMAEEISDGVNDTHDHARTHKAHVRGHCNLPLQPDLNGFKNVPKAL